MQTEVEIMNPYACKSTRIISEKGTIFSKCLRNIQINQTQRHVLHVFLSTCKYRTKSKKLLQNKNQFQRIKKLFLGYFAVQTAPAHNDSATFTVQ